jgi:coatomer subunit beta'
MFIRVYNYNTLERLHQFEAHSDYIRSLAIHPTQSYILTSSGMYDDKSIHHSDY